MKNEIVCGRLGWPARKRKSKNPSLTIEALFSCVGVKEKGFDKGSRLTKGVEKGLIVVKEKEDEDEDDDEEEEEEDDDDDDEKEEEFVFCDASEGVVAGVGEGDEVGEVDVDIFGGSCRYGRNVALLESPCGASAFGVVLFPKGEDSAEECTS